MPKTHRTPEDFPEHRDSLEPQSETEAGVDLEPAEEPGATLSSGPASVDTEPYVPAEPDPEGLRPLPVEDTEEKAHSTKLARLWTATVISVLLLVLLIVFIAQNQDPVTVLYFGLRGEISLGLALFIAALGGALVVAAVGAARVIQLRATARKKRKAERKGL
ncbi:MULTISPECIES: lipopolysaccharide assembly protein LapA domain-containing protein [Micrococcaceae]|uniref:lipopolysaccharide assembly protein LapA domain-containing protein n=1 Tax=Arthrobacter sp. 'calajunan' TaxID=1690248 RepID=UPI003C753B02